MISYRIVAREGSLRDDSQTVRYCDTLTPLTVRASSIKSAAEALRRLGLTVEEASPVVRAVTILVDEENLAMMSK